MDLGIFLRLGLRLDSLESETTEYSYCPSGTTERRSEKFYRGEKGNFFDGRKLK